MQRIMILMSIMKKLQKYRGSELATQVGYKCYSM